MSGRTWAAVAATSVVLVLSGCGSEDASGMNVEPASGGDLPAVNAAGNAASNAGAAGRADAGAGDDLRTTSTGVQGRVTTADGEPVEGATVSRAPVGSDAPITMEAAVTDADGTYFWGMSAGTWDISISHPMYAAVTKQVVIGANQQATLDFVLAP